VATACGQQTDERVDTTATDPAAVASEVAAATPFVTLDCVSLQAMPVDAPPASGVTLGAATAIFQPNGAPAITIATDNQPATALGIADIREGDGAEVQPGDTVTVQYCGVGYGGQAVFDSSWSRGEPATFPLANLIPGWQEGIPGMKVGGQRLLEIPGELAYGEAGNQGIGPNETLVFVIQLDAIG
jgi:peptidylprolyl isomerase